MARWTPAGGRSKLRRREGWAYGGRRRSTARATREPWAETRKLVFAGITATAGGCTTMFRSVFWCLRWQPVWQIRTSGTASGQGCCDAECCGGGRWRNGPCQRWNLDDDARRRREGDCACWRRWSGKSLARRHAVNERRRCSGDVPVFRSEADAAAARHLSAGVAIAKRQDVELCRARWNCAALAAAVAGATPRSPPRSLERRRAGRRGRRSCAALRRGRRSCAALAAAIAGAAPAATAGTARARSAGGGTSGGSGSAPCPWRGRRR